MESDPDPSTRFQVFDTPEQAALSGWRSVPSAGARVVAVEPNAESGGVWVTVAVNGHPHFDAGEVTACAQAPYGRWYEVGSTGP